MNPPLHQTILALQQLKINDKIIESVLTDSEDSNYDTFQKICENLSRDPANKAKDLSRDSVEKAWERALEITTISRQRTIRILSRFDNGFPRLLKNIPNSPLLLHVKGNAAILNSGCVAVVGTRTPLEYSRNKALEISQSLVKTGFTVVSGLAKGIDAAAHEGALQARGHTIAVLAHGLQTIYPAGNSELASRIIENGGALISEYPWYTALEPWRLVQRDRIQSGLSLGVFVIETSIKGGTMHTVDFCKKQNHILAVLNHPREFSSNENISGNVDLIKKSGNKANFIVYTPGEEFDRISERFKKFSKESPESTNIQISLMDDSPPEVENTNTTTTFAGFTTAAKLRSVERGLVTPEESVEKKLKSQKTRKPIKTARTRPTPEMASDQKTL